MKILQFNIVKGANFWSETDKHLVVLKLRIRESEDEREIDVKDLTRRAGRLFANVSEELSKTPPAEIPFMLVGLIAKELMILAGIKCDYARTHPVNDKNECYIILPNEIEKATVFAANAAVGIVSKLLRKKLYDQLKPDQEHLISLRLKYQLGVTTSYILCEIKRREIPFRQFRSTSLIILGYGINQKKIRAAVTDNTSGLGIEIAGDKEETKKLLAEEHIPVPDGILVNTEEELRERIGEVQFPIVVKPLHGKQGRGVTTGINNLNDALFGFNVARKISETVVIEEFVKGDDYRFLLVNFKLVAVAKRIPANVTGNGSATIKQLIEKENRNPERGTTNEFVLAPIVIDEITEKILSDKKLTPDSILPEGQILYLKNTSNISAGGTATDVTELVHPENKFMAERIARMFNLDICGLDIMAGSIENPLSRKTGAVIEVNAGPGLRMHSNPQNGTPRNVAAPIVDMLFPKGKRARIPVVAVADSRGAHVIARLTAYFARLDKYRSGYNSADGVYIQGHLTSRGNCINFENVQEVLYDPTIDFAVVQYGDQSIFESGLAFDLCDVSIFSGFAEKHFQSNGNSDIKDEIKVKTLLIKSTAAHGYAILNLDIEMLEKIEKSAGCKLAFFSLNEKNEKLQAHFKKGGLAATVEKEKILIYRDDKIASISEIKNVFSLPEEDRDLALQIILPAVLAAVARGFSIDLITEGLKTFRFPKLNSWSISLKKDKK